MALDKDFHLIEAISVSRGPQNPLVPASVPLRWCFVRCRASRLLAFLLYLQPLPQTAIRARFGRLRMQIGWGFCVRQRPALSLATRASTLPTLYLLRRSLEPSLGRAKHLARFTRYSVPTGADRPVFEPDSASQDALLGALLTLSEPESPPPGQLPGNQHSEGASEVSLRDHGSARKRIVTEFRARRTGNPVTTVLPVPGLFCQ